MDWNTDEILARKKAMDLLFDRIRKLDDHRCMAFLCYFYGYMGWRATDEDIQNLEEVLNVYERK